MKKSFAKLAAVGMAILMLFSGCGSVNTEAVIVTVDGEDYLTFGYVNFVARYTQSVYDPYYVYYMGEDVWTTEYTDDVTVEENLKNNIMDGLEEVYVINLHADEYGVSLTDEEIAAAYEAAETFIAANDEDTIELLTATVDIVAQYLMDEALCLMVEEAVRQECVTTSTMEDAAQRTFSYVYFSTSSAEDDDEIAEIAANAQALLDADDYEEYAEEMEYTIHTTSYGDGETPLDETAMEVVNEMSEGDLELIYVEDLGYYAVRFDLEYDEEATEEALLEMEEDERDEYLDEMVAVWLTEVDWVVDEKLYAKISFATDHFNTVTDDEDDEE